MEEVELEVVSSASSGPVDASFTLHQKLGLLVSSHPKWAYSILWQASACDQATGRVLLTWRSGHFRVPQTRNKKPAAALEGFLDGSTCDYEWHYMVSVTKSYSASSDGGILGKAFSSGTYLWLNEDHEPWLSECDRFREARAHGIVTIACISVSGGVVELGSSDGIEEDWGLVQLAKSVFSSDPSNNHHDSQTYRSVRQITTGAWSPGFMDNNLSGRFLSGSSPEAQVMGMEGKWVEVKEATAAGTQSCDFSHFYVSVE